MEKRMEGESGGESRNEQGTRTATRCEAPSNVHTPSRAGALHSKLTCGPCAPSGHYLAY